MTVSSAARIVVEEDSASGYRNRTKSNVDRAEATICIANSFSSAGTKLTLSLAGDAAIAVNFGSDLSTNARRVATFLKRRGATRINCAGNGQKTQSGFGVTQMASDVWVYQFLAMVHEIVPLTEIRSGGQTGIDLSGLIAAVRLGIPAIALMPRGFLQRDAQGVDRRHTRAEIEALVNLGVSMLPAVEHLPAVFAVASTSPTAVTPRRKLF